MNAPVPVSIWLTLLVAVVLLVAALGRATRSRAVVIGLVVWGGAVIALAAAGLFSPAVAVRFPLIGLFVFGPVVGFLVAYRRSDRLRAPLARADLRWITAGHVIRVLGADFLVAAGLGILPWHFALPAGIGDIAVGIAALFVARSGSRAAHVAFNVLGLVDLAVAVGTGVLSSTAAHRLITVAGAPPTDALGLLPFAVVPAFIVPILILLHIGALARVYQRTWRGSSSPAPSASMSGPSLPATR